MLTLKELKSMTETAPGWWVDMPSIRQVEASGSRIVVRELVSDMQVTVYRNGYVTCRRDKDWTVFRLHDCGNYKYSAAVAANEEDVAEDIFEDGPWYIRLFLEAEDRLASNQERKHRMHQISLDNLIVDYCPELGDVSWEGLAGLVDREDKKQFRKFLQMMTKKQQRVVLLYFVDREAIKDIAQELGVSYQAVSDMIRKAINRVRKKEGISAAGNPRGVYNHGRKADDEDE